MNGETYSELRRIFGDSFLLYVLNIDDVVVLERSVDELSANESIVLNTLEAIRDVNQRGTGTPEGFAWAARLGIDQYVPEAGSSLANLMRRQAGGLVPSARTSKDPVLAALYAILPDAFPALLLPGERIGSGPPSISRVTHNHPARADLETAVLADPVLSKLFTANSQSGGWQGSAYRSSGQGGSVQLWSFPSQQITIAYAWARLGSDAPTIEDVADKLELSLTTIRKAIQRKTATVPIRIGLTGLLLSPSMSEIDLGWALLRSPTNSDRIVASQTGVEGKLQTSLPDGTVVTIDYAGDVVLCMEIPYKIQLGSISLDAAWPPELQAIQGAVAQDIESLRLGLALALEDDQPALVVQSWQLTIDPLSSAALPGWSDTRSTPNLMPRQLDDEQAGHWRLWTQRVRKHRTPSTAVAVRRMLQALSERNNQEDVLVDAVVVWENLFGAKQETTLRISTALAWLLGRDADDRARLQKLYKDLYGLRSNVVHGAPGVSPEKVSTAARQTVHISLAALRELFHNRADLLAETSSQSRGNKLLLNQSS